MNCNKTHRFILSICILFIVSIKVSADPIYETYSKYFQYLDSLVQSDKSETAVNKLYRLEDRMARFYILGGGLVDYNEYIRPFYDGAVGFLNKIYATGDKYDITAITFRFVERNKILKDISLSFSVPAQYNRLIHHSQIEYLHELHRDFLEKGVDYRVAELFTESDYGDEVVHKLEAAILDIKTEVPDYYQFAYNIQVPTIPEIQNNLLVPGRSYILFHEASDMLTSIIIETDNVRLKTIQLSDDFMEAVALVSRRVSSPPLNNQIDYDLIGACHKLFKAIFEPFWNFDNLPAELVISIDQITGQIPFNTLVTRSFTHSETIGDIGWLIKHTALSYIPYTRYSLYNSRIETSVRGRKPILGVFDEMARTGILTGSENHMIQGFKRLNQELGFSGNILSGSRATRTGFTERYFQYKIIHYDKACENIGPSGPVCLVFEPSRDRNQLLCTNEWYSLDFNADLLVLSSCHLSGTEFINQNQLDKISHAIRHQNGPVLVSSLWPLDHAHNWQIFDQFYQLILAGETIHNALQHSRINLLSGHETWSDIHPYYWAGFVNIGFDSTIDLEKSKKYPIWVMLYLISIFFVFVLYRVFKYRQVESFPSEKYPLNIKLPEKETPLR